MTELMQGVTGYARVAHMSPDDFTREIPRKWNAVETIITAVTEQVAKEELTPLEGYRLIGCAVAETFDYKESHGSFLSASPIDLVNALGSWLPNFGNARK